MSKISLMMHFYQVFLIQNKHYEFNTYTQISYVLLLLKAGYMQHHNKVIKNLIKKEQNVPVFLKISVKFEQIRLENIRFKDAFLTMLKNMYIKCYPA